LRWLANDLNLLHLQHQKDHATGWWQRCDEKFSHGPRPEWIRERSGVLLRNLEKFGGRLGTLAGVGWGGRQILPASREVRRK